MNPEEDAVLLLLIYEHLKLHGHENAAQVLEEHVKQVQTPHVRLNLQDIYTAWIKLCSLAQSTKQEMEDGASLRKSEEAEPASSEEDSGLDVKVFNTTEEENKDKTPASVSDPETEQLKPPDGQRADKDGSESEDHDEEEPIGASTEASNRPQNSSSSDSEDAAGSSSQVDPGTADGLSAPDLTGSDGPERSEDADGPQQETDRGTEVKGGTAALEPTAVSQTEATPPSDEEDEEDAPAEALSQTLLTNLEPLPQETTPPTESEDPEKDEKTEEPQTGSEVTDLTVQPDSEEETKISPISDDLSLIDLVSEETTAAAEEQVDPEVSIMLNVEEDETVEQRVTEELPAEAAESCGDVETPRKKKKKKSKKDSDSPNTNVSIVEISSDSSFSTKKKDKKRPDEVEEQQEVILEKKKKKKSKKRKMEQDEIQENLVETPVNPLETKRKKMVREEQHEVVREMENPASPVEMSEKKKKKKRRRSRSRKKQGEMEVVQSDDLPAGGDRDPGKEPEVTDGDTPQLSTNQKKRRSRKKLSRMMRQRLLCREKRSSQMPGHKKKQKLAQEATPQPKPDKRGQMDSAQDDKNTPKKKKPARPQEENPSKENLPPKKKKKLEPTEDDSGVMSEQIADHRETLPEKRKKKKIKMEEEEMMMSSVVAAEKKKKNRSKEAEEAAEVDPPAASARKKSRKKLTPH